jgi:hypothetical protein
MSLRRVGFALPKLCQAGALEGHGALQILQRKMPIGKGIPGRPFFAYNPFNSQRYTLMAEDAVESAGAKAPAITISIQQFIAGLEVLCHQTIDVPRFIPNSESGASEWQNIALARGLITPPRDSR